MGRKLSNYLCDCGETDVNKFYVTTKSKCKKCVLDKAHLKYGNMSDTDKKNYISSQKNWMSNNLIRYRVLSAKHRAARKNLEFDIDTNFITGLLEEQNFRCKYSNVLLDINNIGSSDNQMCLNSLSIDRKDSTKGYTKNNVILVTAIVNTMKNDLSEELFLKIIDTICFHKGLKIG